MVVLELLLVFEVLDDQEHEPERHREQDPDDCRALLAGLRGANGERHRQAAADEHGGVERAEDDVELAAGFGPRHGIPDAIERVGEEQPAEEQHFGDEEQPHPQRRRFVLLLQRIEVMLEIAVMGGVRAVRIGVRGDGVRQL